MTCTVGLKLTLALLSSGISERQVVNPTVSKSTELRSNLALLSFFPGDLGLLLLEFLYVPRGARNYLCVKR